MRVAPLDSSSVEQLGLQGKHNSTVLLDSDEAEPTGQSSEQPAGLLCLRTQQQDGIVELPSLPPIPESVARDRDLDSSTGSDEEFLTAAESIARLSTSDRLPESPSAFSDWRSRVFDWDFDIHMWAQHEPNFFCLLITEILQADGLLDWKIAPAVMQQFLQRCHARYRANPYHNAAHAADVTQGMAIMMRKGLGAHLSKLERLALLLAAAVHDLGHPGVSNQYLVAARDHWAVVYNDVSVNENMHVSQAFMIAHEVGLFSQLSAEEYEEVRKIIISVILATDMNQHFNLLGVWRQKVTEHPELWQWQKRELLMVMAMHLADIVNPARPADIALKWGKLIVKENMMQGEREKEQGLPASPMCQPVLTPATPQLRFIRTFLGPTLEACRPLAPAFVDMALRGMHQTEEAWEAIQARDGRSSLGSSRHSALLSAAADAASSGGASAVSSHLRTTRGSDSAGRSCEGDGSSGAGRGSGGGHSASALHARSPRQAHS